MERLCDVQIITELLNIEMVVIAAVNDVIYRGLCYIAKRVNIRSFVDSPMSMEIPLAL